MATLVPGGPVGVPAPPALIESDAERARVPRLGEHGDAIRREFAAERLSR
jgi:hypothetical protein